MSQRAAVDTVLTSRDQMMALEGVAGAGKTTSLAAVREAAVRAGYEVEGLAPTSRAAQKLGEAGMETQTLQRHLARGEQADDGQKRLYVVDESSMASTRQMHTFVERLNENDRDYILDARTSLEYRSFSGLLRCFLAGFIGLSHDLFHMLHNLWVKQMIEGFFGIHIAWIFRFGGFRHDRLRKSLHSD